jgi:hypothetical protein
MYLFELIHIGPRLCGSCLSIAHGDHHVQILNSFARGQRRQITDGLPESGGSRGDEALINFRFRISIPGSNLKTANGRQRTRISCADRAACAKSFNLRGVGCRLQNSFTISVHSRLFAVQLPDSEFNADPLSQKEDHAECV